MTSPRIEKFVELKTPDGRKIVFGVPTDIRPVELESPKGSITVRLPSPNDIRFTPIDLRSRIENKARELREFPEKERELLPGRAVELPRVQERIETPWRRQISVQRRNLVIEIPWRRQISVLQRRNLVAAPA